MSVSARHIVWLFAAGCGAFDLAASEAEPECKPPACTTAAPTAKFAVEVQPPTSGRLLGEEFSLTTISPDGVLQLSLSKPLHLSGMIIGDIDPTQIMSIAATRSSRIPGHVDISYTGTLNGNTYSIAAPPNVAGESYTVRVALADAAGMPPIEVTQRLDDDTTLDIELPKLASLRRITGKITDEIDHGIAGYDVVARNPETAQLVSTVAHTGADGTFSLTLARGVSEQVTLVATGVDAMMQPRPSLEQSVVVTETSTAPIAVTMRVVTVPQPIAFALKIEGAGANGTVPVAKATCTFEATLHAVGATQATHRVSATADASGALTASLLPVDSFYTVACLPPADSPFARTSNKIAPSAELGSLTVSAPLRVALVGRVVDSTGVPVKSANVVTMRSDLTVTMASALPVGSTDATGKYRIPIDPGSYNVGVVPPSMAALPRAWSDTVTVDGGGDVSMPDIQLPMAALVKVSVIDAGGAAIKDADVRIYRLTERTRTCTGRDARCLEPAQLLAEGQSDSAGALQLLLPAN